VLLLDGTTPVETRERRIAAFQAGEADVFLISLRAGGVGLNLTAADTVIHLDPWWNPAVEDQATARAHRIGQQRPITAVRLVASGTIEEAMLRLHASKRALAAGILDGGDVAAALTTDELMALIQQSP
jgi:SNF2 family DNA or RNA helicase